MQSFFKKKDPSYFVGGRGGRGGGRRGGWWKRYYDLSSYLFSFLKVLSITFVVQTMTFQAKLPSHCFFKVIPNCFEPELESHIAKHI